MNESHKEKRFIKRPEYPGGKSALLKYISDNLQYPKDAMEQKIEGTVRVWYEVDDNGNVVDSRIIQPLFPSCDKEALRLVSTLKYSRPKNMHLRVKTSFTISIRFRLKQAAQQVTIQYTQANPTKPAKPASPTETYTYTINY
ncbi:MAG: energy transducer TonB [Bacteroidales bacterium]|nr:energy transducer TonB [Bacteroidales bacterium]